MYYEIENHIINIDEVLYIYYNGLTKITIVFKNKTNLNVVIGTIGVVGRDNARKEYEKLLNHLNGGFDNDTSK